MDHEPVTLSSTRVRLRSVRATDGDWLYDLLTRTSGSRWRYRGRTPAPGEFHVDLWRGVLSQFVVTDVDDRPAGLVGAYNANTTAGHCHVFAVGATDQGRLITEATARFADWLFESFEFHKLWIESAEFNLAQFASLTELATIEGRLTNFDYWGGRFWDLLILSVTQERWVSHRRSSRSQSAVRPGASGPGVIGAAALEALLADRLPLDSLRAVELLDELEELAGTVLDYELLDGIDRLDPVGAAEVLAARLATAGAQQSGERTGAPSGNGHSPSEVASTHSSSGPTASIFATIQSR